MDQHFKTNLFLLSASSLFLMGSFESAEAILPENNGKIKELICEITSSLTPSSTLKLCEPFQSARYPQMLPKSNQMVEDNDRQKEEAEKCSPEFEASERGCLPTKPSQRRTKRGTDSPSLPNPAAPAASVSCDPSPSQNERAQGTCSLSHLSPLPQAPGAAQGNSPPPDAPQTSKKRAAEEIEEARRVLQETKDHMKRRQEAGQDITYDLSVLNRRQERLNRLLEEYAQANSGPAPGYRREGTRWTYLNPSPQTCPILSIEDQSETCLSLGSAPHPEMASQGPLQEARQEEEEAKSKIDQLEKAVKSNRANLKEAQQGSAIRSEAQLQALREQEKQLILALNDYTLKWGVPSSLYKMNTEFRWQKEGEDFTLGMGGPFVSPEEDPNDSPPPSYPPLVPYDHPPDEGATADDHMRVDAIPFDLPFSLRLSPEDTLFESQEKKKTSERINKLRNIMENLNLSRRALNVQSPLRETQQYHEVVDRLRDELSYYWNVLHALPQGFLYIESEDVWIYQASTGALVSLNRPPSNRLNDRIQESRQRIFRIVQETLEANKIYAKAQLEGSGGIREKEQKIERLTLLLIRALEWHLTQYRSTHHLKNLVKGLSVIYNGGPVWITQKRKVILYAYRPNDLEDPPPAFLTPPRPESLPSFNLEQLALGEPDVALSAERQPIAAEEKLVQTAERHVQALEAQNEKEVEWHEQERVREIVKFIETHHRLPIGFELYGNRFTYIAANRKIESLRQEVVKLQKAKTENTSVDYLDRIPNQVDLNAAKNRLLKALKQYLNIRGILPKNWRIDTEGKLTYQLPRKRSRLSAPAWKVCEKQEQNPQAQKGENCIVISTSPATPLPVPEKEQQEKEKIEELTERLDRMLEGWRSGQELGEAVGSAHRETIIDIIQALERYYIQYGANPDHWEKREGEWYYIDNPTGAFFVPNLSAWREESIQDWLMLEQIKALLTSQDRDQPDKQKKIHLLVEEYRLTHNNRMPPNVRYQARDHIYALNLPLAVAGGPNTPGQNNPDQTEDLQTPISEELTICVKGGYGAPLDPDKRNKRSAEVQGFCPPPIDLPNVEQFREGIKQAAKERQERSQIYALGKTITRLTHQDPRTAAQEKELTAAKETHDQHVRTYISREKQEDTLIGYYGPESTYRSEDSSILTLHIKMRELTRLYWETKPLIEASASRNMYLELGSAYSELSEALNQYKTTYGSLPYGWTENKNGTFGYNYGGSDSLQNRLEEAEEYDYPDSTSYLSVQAAKQRLEASKAQKRLQNLQKEARKIIYDLSSATAAKEKADSQLPEEQKALKQLQEDLYEKTKAYVADHGQNSLLGFYPTESGNFYYRQSDVDALILHLLNVELEKLQQKEGEQNRTTWQYIGGEIDFYKKELNKLLHNYKNTFGTLPRAWKESQSSKDSFDLIASLDFLEEVKSYYYANSSSAARIEDIKKQINLWKLLTQIQKFQQELAQDLKPGEAPNEEDTRWKEYKNYLTSFGNLVATYRSRYDRDPGILENNNKVYRIEGHNYFISVDPKLPPLPFSTDQEAAEQDIARAWADKNLPLFLLRLAKYQQEHPDHLPRQCVAKFRNANNKTWTVHFMCNVSVPPPQSPVSSLQQPAIKETDEEQKASRNRIHKLVEWVEAAKKKVDEQNNTSLPQTEASEFLQTIWTFLGYSSPPSPSNENSVAYAYGMLSTQLKEEAKAYVKRYGYLPADCLDSEGRISCQRLSP